MSYLPPLAPTLTAALRDVDSQDPARRLAAAERLWGAEEEDARTLPALRGLAKDPVGPVRRVAIHALADAKDSESVDLFEGAYEDPDIFVGLAALQGMVAIRAANARAFVDAWLIADRPEQRATALWCLKEGWDNQAMSALLGGLTDPESSVREAAALALADLADPSAAEALNDRLGDPSPAVRLAAARALARLGDHRATATLIDALDLRGERLEAIEELGALGDAQAIPALLKIASRSFGSLMDRAAAGAALHRLGSPLGASHLRAVLRAWRGYARPFAVQLVGDLRIENLRGELERLAAGRAGNTTDVAWALQQLDQDGAETRSPLHSVSS